MTRQSVSWVRGAVPGILRQVSDCAAIDATVHHWMLDDKRLNGRCEVFRVDVATARKDIEAAAGANLAGGGEPLPCPPDG